MRIINFVFILFVLFLFGCEDGQKGQNNNNLSYNKASVHYDFANGDSYIEEVSIGDTIHLPIEGAQGKKISYWTSVGTDLKYKPGISVLINTSVVHFVANYEQKMFRISYSAGSDATNVPPTEYYESGTTTHISQVTPVRDGYNFKGWSYKGNVYISPSSIVVRENVLFGAIWERISLNLSFDLNGGQGNFPKTSFWYGSPIKLPGTIPIRSGFEFTNWLWEGVHYNPSTTLISKKDITVVAQWKKEEKQEVKIEYHFENSFHNKSITYTLDTYVRPYDDAGVSKAHYWYDTKGFQVSSKPIYLDQYTIQNLGGKNSVIKLYEKGWSGIATDWLAGISDSMQISEILIPGTHDSVADVGCAGGSLGKTQTESISEQLERGIRFLDFRTRHYNDSFSMHHGSCYLDTTFANEIKHVTSFLKKHPTEFVIISLKPEHTSQGNHLSYQDVFEKYLDDLNMRDMWYLDNMIPTVRGVRGKIVLLNRAGSALSVGLKPTNWKDNYDGIFSSGSSNEFRIQDFYQPGSGFFGDSNAVSKKKSVISKMLSESESSNPGVMFLNYCSGYLYDFNINNLIDDDINPWLNNVVKNKKNYRGIIINDYASKGDFDFSNMKKELKLNIIRHNFY